MTAGTGITHSEFNPSLSTPLHFLQIWIIPERTGLKPGYEQKSIGARPHNVISVVASRTGYDQSLTVHQDANLYIGTLDSGKTIDRTIAQNRKTYLHVARGKVVLNGIALEEGDGAKISGERQLSFSSPDQGEILLFDLP